MQKSSTMTVEETEELRDCSNYANAVLASVLLALQKSGVKVVSFEDPMVAEPLRRAVAAREALERALERNVGAAVSLEHFNCAECGHPHYAHVTRAPGACEKFTRSAGG